MKLFVLKSTPPVNLNASSPLLSKTTVVGKL